ncbi:hypothetical protein [Bdellovibrio sp. HCB337]|uniref:hypothetical protein n=1 Tax=Bdellovibrio sp. HCB337 TaxID=3394358 RepID=UPI0039A61F15
MKHVLGLLLLSVVLTACSGSSSSSPGGGEQPPFGKPDGSQINCDEIITPEAIDAFHARQSEFRVEGSGGNVYCKSERNINGKKTVVEKKGRSKINIHPNMQLIAVEKDTRTQEYILRVQLTPVSDVQLQNILVEIGVTAKDPQSMLDASYVSFPDYARFEKGALYYFKRSPVSAGVENQILFNLQAEQGEGGALAWELQDLAKGTAQIEGLWQRGAQFYRQTIARQKTTSEWSNLSELDVLVSFVKDHVRSGSQSVFKRGLQYAFSWDVSLQALNAGVPELYSFADSQWQQLPPVFERDTDLLVNSLRYLSEVNSNYPKKPILDAYVRIVGFSYSKDIALTTAIEYVEGKKWTSAQFDQTVNLAAALSHKFGAISWYMATDILDRTDYDQTQAALLGKAAGVVVREGLLSLGDVPKILDAAQRKIQNGLTLANADLYVLVYDVLQADFKADSFQAEKIADAWVLSGRVTNANVNDTFKLYGGVFEWLKNEWYYGSSSSLEKSREYMEQGMTADQFNSLKDLANWYKDKLYITKSEALTRVEILVLKGKVGAAQAPLIKDLTQWLISDIYVNRSDAVAKTEAYVLNTVNPLTAVTLKQFKTLVNWYVSELYVTKSDAIQNAEDLVFNARLTTDQTDLVQKAGNWLIRELYINKSEGVAKASRYILEANMTAQSFEALKNEYNRLSSRQGKTQALKEAERLVLGLN